MAARPKRSKAASPKAELAAFIAKFSPEVAKNARAILAKMRKLVPGANELVYDNYNALAIGFAPTDRAGHVVMSIALYPRWVSIFFFGGPKLPDPKKLLRGSGTRVRHIVLEEPAMLDDPAIRTLIEHALARAKPPIDPAARGCVIIKAVSAKQRPRRPSSAQSGIVVPRKS